MPLTVVGNDGPGHGRSVDAANHPEHAEPTEVLTPLLPSQDFSKVGEHSGNGASNPVKKYRGHMRLRRGQLRRGEVNPEETLIMHILSCSWHSERQGVSVCPG